MAYDNDDHDSYYDYLNELDRPEGKYRGEEIEVTFIGDIDNPIIGSLSILSVTVDPAELPLKVRKAILKLASEVEWIT